MRLSLQHGQTKQIVLSTRTRTKTPPNEKSRFTSLESSTSSSLSKLSFSSSEDRDGNRVAMASTLPLLLFRSKKGENNDHAISALFWEFLWIRMGPRLAVCRQYIKQKTGQTRTTPNRRFRYTVQHQVLRFES